MAEAVQPKLAEVLAEVGDLIEAHERAYAARTYETSDRLAAAQRWEPSRAYLRQNRDNAAFMAAQAFYSREVDRHEDAGKRGMAFLRAPVDALAVENFGARGRPGRIRSTPSATGPPPRLACRPPTFQGA
ncbi:hypothetical protein AB0283_13055 [Micromonospora vinacea]|uniref:hypothetical protein n=1 Tax=Micromonospora vinacea TaxID=709878 RepID=UPI00344B817C